MTATNAGVCISRLEDRLQDVEMTEERASEDWDKNAMNKIAVRALFVEMSLIVQVVKTDPDGWGEIARFSQSAAQGNTPCESHARPPGLRHPLVNGWPALR